MEERYYTPEQVAAMFQVTRQAVYGWISRGMLRAVKVGGMTRITQSALDEFVKPIERDN